MAPQMMRAMIDAASINVEERTLEVTFATDNPVRMWSWEDGYVNEILSFENGHVRWDRINSGGPVLDNHQRYGSIADTQIGVVERAWSEGGTGKAKIRFAKDEKAELIWQRVQDKIIRNISVGYSVFAYEKTEREGQTTQYRAIDWEPNEISFVPVPADYNAGVRNQGQEPQHDVTIFLTNNQRAMTIEQKRAEVARLKGLATRSAEEDQQLRQLEAEIAAHERSANPPAPAPAPAPTVDVAAERAAAVKAERERSKAIKDAVRAANMDEAFADQMIEAGHSIDMARKLIIDKFAEGDGAKKPQSGNRSAAATQVGADETDKRRAAMTDALSMRAGQQIEKPADGARDFRGMTLLRMAEECLIAQGENVRGLSQRQIAEAALNIRSGYMSTSDFPIILGNTVNRSLRAAYELQPRTFMPFCRRTNLNDFREITKAQLSGLVGDFEEVKEGGEYKYGKMTEAKESYKLVKYGKMLAITWETLINDDLDAFSRIPASIAAAAAQKQSDIVWGILLNNPTMADGKAIFHADHGNLGSSSAINEAGLSAARKAMRIQKNLENRYINVAPRYMMIGPDKETEAQKLLQATIVATKTADTNVFRSFTELIVEPRVTGNKWFLSADPATIDTIEYAFLDGEGELFTEQRTGFDVDGIEIKARMVFAAKAIDHRGLYYNPGA